MGRWNPPPWGPILQRVKALRPQRPCGGRPPGELSGGKRMAARPSALAFLAGAGGPLSVGLQVSAWAPSNQLFCPSGRVAARGARPVRFRLYGGPSAGRSSRGVPTIVTWLILPVVICLSQRLSHACLSISNYTVKLRMAHYISYRLFDSTLLLG